MIKALNIVLGIATVIFVLSFTWSISTPSEKDDAIEFFLMMILFVTLIGGVILLLSGLSQ